LEQQADLADAARQRDLAQLDRLALPLVHRHRRRAVDEHEERVGRLPLLHDGLAGFEALELRDLDQLRELLRLEGAEQRALAEGGVPLRLQLLGEGDSLHRGLLRARAGAKDTRAAARGEAAETAIGWKEMSMIRVDRPTAGPAP